MRSDGKNFNYFLESLLSFLTKYCVRPSEGLGPLRTPCLDVTDLTIRWWKVTSTHAANVLQGRPGSFVVCELAFWYPLVKNDFNQRQLPSRRVLPVQWVYNKSALSQFSSLNWLAVPSWLRVNGQNHLAQNPPVPQGEILSRGLCPRFV